MSDTSIFEIDNMSVDMKEYVKLRCRAVLDDSVIFKFLVFSNSSPVDLSQYKCEFRARLPKSGQVYSETDNISTNGNELTVICENALTSEIGEVIITIRLFDIVTYQQKSNYIIILKVLSTIDADEEIQTKGTLSALESLDMSINRYIEAKFNLFEGIDDSKVALNNLNTTITTSNTSKSNLETTIENASNSKSNLESTISNANDAKTDLQTSISNTINDANTTKTDLENTISEKINDVNNTISNANTVKSNLEKSMTDEINNVNNAITSANTIKSNLENTISNSSTSKVDLQAVINTADAELQAFKSYDTTELVPKTNTMLNEMYCTNELLSINHGLNDYPKPQLIYAEDGAGLGGAGLTPAGGTNGKFNELASMVEYNDLNNMTIYVPNNYFIASPSINKINDYKYIVTFANSTKSILIKLSL